MKHPSVAAQMKAENAFLWWITPVNFIQWMFFNMCKRNYMIHVYKIKYENVHVSISQITPYYYSINSMQNIINPLWQNELEKW